MRIILVLILETLTEIAVALNPELVPFHKIDGYQWIVIIATVGDLTNYFKNLRKDK